MTDAKTTPTQSSPIAWLRYQADGRPVITAISRVAELWREQGCAVVPLYDQPAPPQSNVKAVPHEPTPDMIAAAMRADQDGGSASMKTIWMVMWGAYAATTEGQP